MAASWSDRQFSANISPAGDHDRFLVNLTAGRPYIFENVHGSLSDPTLAVRESINLPFPFGLHLPGRQVAFNDDGGRGLDSRIEFTPPHSGFYFLEGGGFASGTGTSRVTMRADDHPDDIDTPPTDRRSNSNDNIFPNGVRSGIINTAPDQDYFGINLVRGQHYTFDVIGGTLRDPTLDVRDRNDVVARDLITHQPASNDDFGGSFNSHIDFTAPTTDTYYLNVGGFAANTGSYTLFA
jgi:hypothetical protein